MTIPLEILLLWIWINSISAIYYVIKNPFKREMGKIEIGILAYMLTGTFWLFRIYVKFLNKFRKLSEK